MKGGEIAKRFLGWVYGFVVGAMLLGFPAAFASTTYAPLRYVYGVGSQSMSYIYTLGSTRNAGDYVAGDYTASPIPTGGYFINAVVTSTGSIHVHVEYSDSTGDSGVSAAGTGSSQTVSYSLNATKKIIAVWITSSASFSVSGASVTVAPLPPTTPTGLSVSSIGFTSAKLSWSAVTNADGYRLYNVYTGVQIADVSTTSYSWNGLTAGTTYQVAVSAYNASGESPKSGTVSFSTIGVSAPPTNFRVTNIGDTSALLSWTASANASGYNLYDSSGKFANTGGTSYQLSGLKAGSSYTVWVTAVNPAGESGSSSPVTFNTTVPVTPTGLAASIGDGWVQLSWNLTSGDQYYYVYQDGKYVGKTNTNNYRVSGLVNGDTYSFTISGVDYSGTESAQTAPVTARPQPPPVPVNGLQGYGGGTQVKYVWGGTMTPFVLVVKQGTNVVGTYNVAGDTYTVSGLKTDTDYTATVTDAGQNSLSVTLNTGKDIVVFPPAMPDEHPTIQNMVSGFGDAGKYVMDIIVAAVALGAILVLLFFIWRQTKKWNGRAVTNGAGKGGISAGTRRLIYGKRYEYGVDGKWHYQGQHVKGTKWHKRQGDGKF